MLCNCSKILWEPPKYAVEGNKIYLHGWHQAIYSPSCVVRLCWVDDASWICHKGTYIMPHVMAMNNYYSIIDVPITWVAFCAHGYPMIHACLLAGTEDLKCPITCEVMMDPVLAAGGGTHSHTPTHTHLHTHTHTRTHTDGYTYERTAITSWFSKGRRTSPVTNLPLTNTLLLPNRALKKILEKHSAKTAN